MAQSDLDDPTPQRGGKRKRFHLLRHAGVAALRATHAALAEMAHGLRPRLEVP